MRLIIVKIWTSTLDRSQAAAKLPVKSENPSQLYQLSVCSGRDNYVEKLTGVWFWWNPITLLSFNCVFSSWNSVTLWSWERLNQLSINAGRITHFEKVMEAQNGRSLIFSASSRFYSGKRTWNLLLFVAINSIWRTKWKEQFSHVSLRS